MYRYVLLTYSGRGSRRHRERENRERREKRERIGRERIGRGQKREGPVLNSNEQSSTQSIAAYDAEMHRHPVDSVEYCST